MLKHLLVIAALMPIIGCAKGGDEDPMEVWNEWRAEIEGNAVLSNVEMFPSKGGDMHVTLELDHATIVTAGNDSLDTGLTKEMCEESPLPVELWIKIPELDRNWYGNYDNDAGEFVINEIFEGSHPDLTPEYRVETQTFVIWLPSEG
ncbi:MAG: hypothetical protein GY771_11690 [bacterium]|nr:hypothetical protein [bacterium]